MADDGASRHGRPIKPRFLGRVLRRPRSAAPDPQRHRAGAVRPRPQDQRARPGYGAWEWLTVTGATAGAILKWAGIGAAAGALALSALIAAIGVAFIGAIFWGLGLLLNLLAG
jgi:hypothetical protein